MNNSVWESSNSGTKAEQIPLEHISSWENKNFYQRLGVTTSASKDEIENAFKKLSTKYHPDKIINNDKLKLNFQEVQKLISEAKTTLTDQESRKRYNKRIGVSLVHHSVPQNPFPSSRFDEEFDDNNDDQEELNPKTEGGKIALFISYVRNNLGDGEDLLGMMNDFIQEYQIKKEVLIKGIEESEKSLIDYFTEYARHNFDNPREFSRLQKMRNDLIILGIKEGKIPNLSDF